MIDKEVDKLYNKVTLIANEPSKRFSVSDAVVTELMREQDFPTKDFDKVYEQVKMRTPLTKRKENVFWPYLTLFRYLTKYPKVARQDIDYSKKCLYILVYKFWNTAMWRSFPRGFDETVFEMTIASLSKKFYLTKHGSISKVIEVLAEGLNNRVNEKLKKGEDKFSILEDLITQSRNRTSQIMKALAKQYYDMYDKTKKGKDKEGDDVSDGQGTEAESVDSRLSNILNLFINEKNEFKKDIVTTLAKNLGVRPLYPYYVLVSFDTNDIPTLIPALARVVNLEPENTVLTAFSRSKELVNERKAFFELVHTKVQENDILKERYKTLADSSKRKIAYICIIALYRYYNAMKKRKV